MVRPRITPGDAREEHCRRPKLDAPRRQSHQKSGARFREANHSFGGLRQQPPMTCSMSQHCLEPEWRGSGTEVGRLSCSFSFHRESARIHSGSLETFPSPLETSPPHLETLLLLATDPRRRALPEWCRLKAPSQPSNETALRKPRGQAFVPLPLPLPEWIMKGCSVVPSTGGWAGWSNEWCRGPD